MRTAVLSWSSTSFGDIAPLNLNEYRASDVNGAPEEVAAMLGG
jgi:hypothetical protein